MKMHDVFYTKKRISFSKFLSVFHNLNFNNIRDVETYKLCWTEGKARL